MSQTLEELELHALQLPAEEKARLALHLLESLEPSDTGDLEDAWRREAELRLDALESGSVQTVSADEAFHQSDSGQARSQLRAQTGVDHLL